MTPGVIYAIIVTGLLSFSVVINVFLLKRDNHKEIKKLKAEREKSLDDIKINIETITALENERRNMNEKLSNVNDFHDANDAMLDMGKTPGG